jgi:hypothetical protein
VEVLVVLPTGTTHLALTVLLVQTVVELLVTQTVVVQADESEEQPHKLLRD